MDNLWKKLVLKCDTIQQNIMPEMSPYLLSDLFSNIMQEFYSIMIPKRVKFVLNLNQLTRIEHIIKELKSFFIEGYNINDYLIKNDEYLYRVNLLLKLQISGSKMLINHHQTLNNDDDWKNEYQLNNEPYLGPKALWLIIKARAKAHKHDEIITKYYNKHNTLKLQFKAFKNSVKGYFNSK